MVKVVDLVEVESVGSDCFKPVSGSPLTRRTLFGGALMGQGMRSAAATIGADKFPHSLHANFIRAGRADHDLEFRVERVRDGRAFATRQVTAAQGDRIILTMSVSFHCDEPSPEYAAATRQVRLVEEATHMSGESLGMDIIELSAGASAEPPGYLAWARAQQEMPDDRVLHACVMAFLSDCGPPVVAAAAIGIKGSGPDREGGPGNMTTSLDHSMWFHRAGRIDDWALVEGIPLSTANSRGLMMGTMHDREGRHLATFTQEQLIRIDPS